MRINQGISLILFSVICLLTFSLLQIDATIFYILIGFSIWRLDNYWEVGRCSKKLKK